MAAAALDDEHVVGTEVGDAGGVKSGHSHVRDLFATMERQRVDLVKIDG